MIVDLYPSRKGEKATILERKDPIIYNATSNSGPLEEEQLHTYEKDGYLFLESFFSDEEVKVMEKELKSVLAEYKNSESEIVIREHGSDEIRSVFEVHKNSSFFSKLSKDERLVSIAKQLLGSDVYITQSRVNFKPGFKGKEFYWHSDFETWHVEDGMPNMRAVSCSIILTDNYHFNGPLMLIPGSHKWYVSCSGTTPENNYKSSLKKQEIGVPDHESLAWLVSQSGGRIDSAVGPKGSVLFFECNIMHGSNANLSPFPRNNVFFVYNSVENKLVQPFSGGKPRPEFLANREPLESKV